MWRALAYESSRKLGGSSNRNHTVVTNFVGGTYARYSSSSSRSSLRGRPYGRRSVAVAVGTPSSSHPRYFSNDKHNRDKHKKDSLDKLYNKAMYSDNNDAFEDPEEAYADEENAMEVTSRVARERGSPDPHNGGEDEDSDAIVLDWTDPYEITDEEWSSKVTFDEIPNWSPKMVSRIANERLQIYKDGIPTLSALSKLRLPHPSPPHPGDGSGYHMKYYAAYRKREQYAYIKRKVALLAGPKIPAILKLSSWEEKQDAIDALFEAIERIVRKKEPILKEVPHFNTWIEQALEIYLRHYETNQKEAAAAAATKKTATPPPTTENEQDASSSLTTTSTGGEEKEEEKNEKAATRMSDHDTDALPLFMDCAVSANQEEEEEEESGTAPAAETDDDESSTTNEGTPPPMVPDILLPLTVPYSKHNHDGFGRMVEEWELSAHKTTKRILLRQCTRQIAKYLSDVNVVTTTTTSDTATPATTNEDSHNDHHNNTNKNVVPRIYVTGKQGVGKTATLASIVASARKSGYIVLYMPDGDRLHKLGHYITKNSHRADIYDLPVLSQEICNELHQSHGADFSKHHDDFVVPHTLLQHYFTDLQLENKILLKDDSDDSDSDQSDSDSDSEESKNDISLLDLLEIGCEDTKMAPMVYATVMHYLMEYQTTKPFLVVMDEFNCYYNEYPGQYFHREYDPAVQQSIPYQQISLFQPLLTAMELKASNKKINKKNKKNRKTRRVGDIYDDVEDDFENEEEDAAVTPPPPPSMIMQRGGFVVGITESRAVPRHITDSLTLYAKKKASVTAAAAAAVATDTDTNTTSSSSTSTSYPYYVVEVPHYSKLEVEHILANYEATGIGNLRNDQGEILRNEQQVSYLRMISGGIGQKLLDACCW